MKTYQITTTSGTDMGIYRGETAEDAVRALCIDAGHTEAALEDPTSLAYVDMNTVCTGHQLYDPARHELIVREVLTQTYRCWYHDEPDAGARIDWQPIEAESAEAALDALEAELVRLPVSLEDAGSLRIYVQSPDGQMEQRVIEVTGELPEEEEGDEPITDDQIRALREESGEGGDIAQVACCDVALGEVCDSYDGGWQDDDIAEILTWTPERARAECARVIEDAQAQQ